MATIPGDITREHVEAAIRDLDAGKPHEFGESTGYDLLFDGRRYPPKAVIGLAAAYVRDGVPLGPYDFKGGLESQCLRVLEDLGFTIVRKPGRESSLESEGDAAPESDAANEGSEWSDVELEAAVVAYFEMLERQEQGVPYNKAETNRQLREGVLSRRSRGSVEFRMGNISATLDELCCPTLRGYVPQKNVGANVKDRIRSILERRGLIDSALYRPTEDESVLDTKVRALLQRGIQGTPRGNVEPKRGVQERDVFERDPLVKAWTLRSANGRCELCGLAAPFLDRSGQPFLEVHHVVPLAEGGPDVVSNAVALCPNCHRRCHHSNDRETSVSSLYEKLKRLTKPVA